MKRFISVFLAASVAASSAYAAEPEDTQALPGGVAGAATVVTATVEAIDLEKRRVTLKGADGNEVTVTVSEEARNLPQLRVGDVVTFKYYQVFGIALTPVEGAIRERTESTQAFRAPKGEKPGAAFLNTVDVVGTVESIDREHRVVTLRGAERTLSLVVSKDVDLSPIKEGQQVRATYVQAFAVSVGAPAQAPAK